MSSITMKSFADSSGSSAGKKEGGFAGKLLGKAAEGMDAIEAFASLAKAKVNRFMELAAQAAHVAKQTLEAAKTMPFANPDMDFNPTLNVEKAVARRQAPSLGLGSGSSGRRQKKDDEDRT